MVKHVPGHDKLSHSVSSLTRRRPWPARTDLGQQEAQRPSNVTDAGLVACSAVRAETGVEVHVMPAVGVAGLSAFRALGGEPGVPRDPARRPVRR